MSGVGGSAPLPDIRIQSLECLRCSRAIALGRVSLADGLCEWCRTHDDEGNVR